MSALQYMHSLGVYHRDLKPKNIMVSEQVTILLGDFGATTNQERLDGQTGIFTEHYADLDARFKRFSWASDIYSFGLCAYFILWGRHLYTRDNHKQWLDNS